MFPTPLTGEEEAEGLKGWTTTKTKPAWTHHTQNLPPWETHLKWTAAERFGSYISLDLSHRRNSAFPGFHFSLKAVARRPSEHTWGDWGTLLPTVEARLRQEPQMPISNMPHLPGLCYPPPMSLARAARWPSLEEVLSHFLWFSEALISPLSLSAGVWSTPSSGGSTSLSKSSHVLSLVFQEALGWQSLPPPMWEREVILPPWLTHQGKAGPPFFKGSDHKNTNKKTPAISMVAFITGLNAWKEGSSSNNWLALHKQ